MEKHIKEQELWEIYIRVQWDTETEAPDLRRGQYRGPAVLQRWQHGIVLPRAEFWITGVCQELGAVEESSRQIEYMDSNGEARCRLVKGPAQLRQILCEAVEDVHRGQERKAGGWRPGHTKAHVPGSGIQALLPTPGVCKLCQRPDGK